jgi:hypothetical protein
MLWIFKEGDNTGLHDGRRKKEDKEISREIL